jgi:hypothetical protein
MKIHVLPLLVSISVCLSWPISVAAQSAPASTASATKTSDPTALTLLSESATALSGGVTFSDLALTGNVKWAGGSQVEDGTGTFKVKGTQESRFDLALGTQTRYEIRNDTAGYPNGEYAGPDGVVHPMALHNCWVAAGGFAPISLVNALGSLVVTYVGRETHESVPVDHIHAVRVGFSKNSKQEALIESLSAADLYLDASSHLPLFLDFKTHADNDYRTNISVEVRYSQYQKASGMNIPFHIQRVVQSTVNLDFTVASAVLNSGIPDSAFTLQ